MTVREFLASHTSADITELRAYELLHGPIGQGYEREALAAIHEELQMVTLAVAASAGVKKEDIRNKDGSPKIKRYPRPHDRMNVVTEGE